MNVALVDKNLYVGLLRSRDILNDIGTSTVHSQNSNAKQPDTRLSTFDSQNRKTKKPNIPPRQRTLTTNHKLVTSDLSA